MTDNGSFGVHLRLGIVGVGAYSLVADGSGRV